MSDTAPATVTKLRAAFEWTRTLMFGLVVLGSCKQEQEAPPTYPASSPAPGAANPPAPYAAPAPGGVPAPSAPAAGTSVAPAVGFGCGSDLDPQCPFSRCLGGRCGGCRSAVDCKPGSQCFPSWVGQVCLPGAAPVATPTPAPGPAPPAATLPAPAAPVPTPVPATAPSAADPMERARQLCVAKTNEYRARVGVGPVGRRADAEACGDAQARADARSRTAHGAFGQCREQAQNECPAWAGTPESVVDRCLAMMFAEGPGAGPAHGHYTNMTAARSRGVACGIAATASGELWVVQNFYP